MSSASTESGCDGCRHRNLGEAGDWCYMFKEAPEELPCGQHDKFMLAVQARGRLLIKNPSLIPIIIDYNT